MRATTFWVVAGQSPASMFLRVYVYDAIADSHRDHSRDDVTGLPKRAFVFPVPSHGLAFRVVRDVPQPEFW